MRSVGLHTTPFLPSLLHEAKLGFDVAFDRPGLPLLLQFKLGEALQRFRDPDNSAPPTLSRPFWRFRVDTAEPNGQFDLLLKAEQAGAEVYYVAPRLTGWDRYVSAFEQNRVLRSSLLMKPSEIDTQLDAGKEPDGLHRIVYDRSKAFVFSHARELAEVKARDLATKIRGEIERRSRRMDIALQEAHEAIDRQRMIRVREDNRDEGAEETYVKRVPNTAELATDPQRVVAERSRRFSEFRGRAVTEADARFAVIGLEAWAAGAQLVAVTLQKKQE
jgi:hypothetical protein